MQGGGGTGGPSGWVGGGFGLPRPTRVALGLMAACAAVFLLGVTSPLRLAIAAYLSLMPDKIAEVWRLITFQFVHAGAVHLMWNMVGLYFFGPPLERDWGSRRFLVFYLVCGVFGGLCYLLLSLFVPFSSSLVGASGGILGCLMACAILHPEFIFIIFPIRWVAGFYVVLYVLGVIYDKALSDAAHLGGMVAAAGWIWLLPRVVSARFAFGETIRQGAWQRVLKHRRSQQEEIDRILEKIHTQGLQSLTGKERRKLQQASRRQRQEDKHISRL